MEPFPPPGPGQPLDRLVRLHGSNEALFGVAGHAYNAMWLAAKADGITLVAVSGHRSNAEQAELYRRWIAGTGNLAAVPGTSRHEYGQAVDIDTGNGATDPPQVKWLRRNARRWRFAETVVGERWHWQYMGSDMDEEVDDMLPINDWWRLLRVIGSGDAHPAVEVMQRALAASGVDPGPVDSVMGDRTRAAWKQWEASTYGADSADEIPGKYSWARILRDTLDATPAKHSGADLRPQIADLEAKLATADAKLATASTKIRAARLALG